VFTARYALSPYIKPIPFVFKGLRSRYFEMWQAEPVAQACASFDFRTLSVLANQATVTISVQERHGLSSRAEYSTYVRCVQLRTNPIHTHVVAQIYVPSDDRNWTLAPPPRMFHLGRGGAHRETTYSLCLILKIMLKKHAVSVTYSYNWVLTRTNISTCSMTRSLNLNHKIWPCFFKVHRRLQTLLILFV
jgi:hypothetical protein